jgi:hypothetical protein
MKDGKSVILAELEREKKGGLGAKCILMKNTNSTPRPPTS